MYFHEDDTNVCSLLRLVDLGGKVVNGDEDLDRQDGREDGDGSIPFGVFKEHLLKMCQKWDYAINANWNGRWSYFGTKYVPKMVIQAVTATPGQEFAEKHLEKIGFTKSGPFRKLKHPGTKLTFWHMTGEDFCSSIGYVSEYDPRGKE